MRTTVRKWQLIALCALLVVASACGKNGNEDEKMGGSGRILIGATIANPDGQSGQSYIQVIPELKGELEVNKGVQIGFAASLSFEGNYVFVFPEFGPNGKQEIAKYECGADGIRLAGTLPIPPNSYPINLTSVSPEKAYVPLYLLGKVMIINPKSMRQLGGLIDLTGYAHKDNNPDPSHGLIREGIYYLPLTQINENWMPYDDYRQIDVALIDTRSDKVIKIVKETESGLSFPVRPYNKNQIYINESNDIYMASLGSWGFRPDYVKNGFVCIPAGKQEFDPSRSWDISTTPIEGSEYKSACVINSCYLGNGKLAAYVIVPQLMGSNPYTSRYNMAVLIDINAKTIKRIEGIPYTDGYTTAIEAHKGEVFFSAYGEEKAGVFAFNPATGAVRQALSAKGRITYIHFFD